MSQRPRVCVLQFILTYTHTFIPLFVLFLVAFILNVILIIMPGIFISFVNMK